MRMIFDFESGLKAFCSHGLTRAYNSSKVLSLARKVSQLVKASTRPTGKILQEEGTFLAAISIKCRSSDLLVRTVK